MEAIKGALPDLDEFKAIDLLHQTSGTAIPQAVEEIRSAAIRHKLECDIDQMKDTVLKILGIS